MKEILKSLPFTTIIVTYLFICGGSYLVGFWGTFNVDAFSLVQIWDIPKNFIASFLLSGGVSIIMVSIMALFYPKGDFYEIEHRTDENIFWKFIEITLFMLTLVVGSYFYSDLKYYPQYWSAMCIIISGIIIIQIMKMPYYKKIIRFRTVRLCVAIVVIFSPASSFLYGKKNALKIHSNRKIKIVAIETNKIKNTNSGDSLYKFLGFLGDKFIISSFDNKKIYYLNQSAFDVIETGDTTVIDKK